MAEKVGKLLGTAERRDAGGAVAHIKLVVIDDHLNLHAYEDGKLLFQKTLSRLEAVHLAYQILGALKNGSEHTGE